MTPETAMTNENLILVRTIHLLARWPTSFDAIIIVWGNHMGFVHPRNVVGGKASPSDPLNLLCYGGLVTRWAGCHWLIDKSPRHPWGLRSVL